MAGLGNPNAPPPGGMTTSADMMPRDPQQPGGQAVGDEEGEVPNVSDEEQEQYEVFLKAGLLLLYAGSGDGGEAKPEVLQMLDEDPSDLIKALGDVEELTNLTPAVALAATAAIITLELVENSPPQFADDPEGDSANAVIMHGGKALLEELANLAKEAGIYDYSEEEISKAMLMGADLYREAAVERGLIDPESLKQQFGELVTAEKEGRLGEILPPLGGMEGPPAAAPPPGGA